MLIPRERNMRLDLQLPNHPLGFSLYATSYKEYGAAYSLVQSRRDPSRDRMTVGLIKQQEHLQHTAGTLLGTQWK